MEGKSSSNIILLVIIAFLSLAVAAFAGYVFLGGGGSGSSSSGTPADTKPEVIVPTDDELASVSVFGDQSTILNLKSGDGKGIAAIKLKVDLQYLKEVEGIKNPALKIETYSNEIKSLIGSYFMNMTPEEAQLTETKENKAPEYLKNAINELLTRNEKEKNPIVYKIIFVDWFYFYQ